ncbi:retrovirus-related Pol polyprotein from transposon 17.6 [Trichonephila clavipes]|nr:retrovirus-related Pol polyprotein from transposon 17.6 [Trichonephila clavipes]
MMSVPDLRSGYFQLAVNPSDIAKTAFVTKNDTYAFRRMSFGLSGASLNFQKAIDIILKPLIGNKWAEAIPLKKASAQVIADIIFYNYISCYGTPIKLISDSGPQFISDIFEHLSDKLGIRHVKTVVYRPQANRTERMNRDLKQMIANYVEDQHDTWHQFLREFAYAVRTAVNETTGKTPAELFLGLKLITQFQKLVMLLDGTEFLVLDIERLFDEARRNTKTKHEKWAKYCDRRRCDVQIKVNDWILIKNATLKFSSKEGGS